MYIMIWRFNTHTHIMIWRFNTHTQTYTYIYGNLVKYAMYEKLVLSLFMVYSMLAIVTSLYLC